VEDLAQEELLESEVFLEILAPVVFQVILVQLVCLEPLVLRVQQDFQVGVVCQDHLVLKVSLAPLDCQVHKACQDLRVTLA